MVSVVLDAAAAQGTLLGKHYTNGSGEVYLWCFMRDQESIAVRDR